MHRGREGSALIEFRMLGPLEAWRDGVRLELGGRKQRALLAALLIRANHMVPVERLIDDLWPNDPPARAVASIQVFISDLRRALEPDRARGEAATVLVTAAPGYRLVVDPDAVDALRFSRLAEQTRSALVSGDLPRAAQLAAAADACWSGPVLADVADSPFAAAEAALLVDARLGCLEDGVEADLALGRHAEVLAGLERRVAEHPLAERSRAQLMLALYRCGRQADSLTSYAAGRRVLAEDLGLEPGPALRGMHEAVLRQDADLYWAPEPAPPAPRPPVEVGEEAGRVLVVDDSGINRRLLVEALGRLGHEVRTAENGRRALDLLAAGEQADLVLLDLLMPVLDGYATLAALKANPATAHLPVIMISAVHEMESVVRCIDLGATDYLPKPFSAEVLRARIHSSLAAKRMRDVERGDLQRWQALAGEVRAREADLRAEIDALRAELARSAAGP
ncbi:MAG TPA: BTAD domain-containing putative transcriptional regulator [Sporichthyaceae bacterium]|nr:BTAD domain-containing putative transcriptional regulator [Sporichthyaceae bacterium]